MSLATPFTCERALPFCFESLPSISTAGKSSLIPNLTMEQVAREWWNLEELYVSTPGDFTAISVEFRFAGAKSATLVEPMRAPFARTCDQWGWVIVFRFAQDGTPVAPERSPGFVGDAEIGDWSGGEAAGPISLQVALELKFYRDSDNAGRYAIGLSSFATSGAPERIGDWAAWGGYPQYESQDGATWTYMGYTDWTDLLFAGPAGSGAGWTDVVIVLGSGTISFSYKNPPRDGVLEYPTALTIPSTLTGGYYTYFEPPS